MPTRKIADLPQRCTDPGHRPPMHIVYSPGVYEHTCPKCGQVTRFTVDKPQLNYSAVGALDQSDIKCYLNGLIKRDVSSEGVQPDPGLVDGTKKLVVLSAPGSIRYLAVDRAELLKLATDGWIFDEDTMKWAEE